ncbi:hypothetical protein [Arthrobacter sp. CG_A4]|uniref:hypothetical protein n=1 Tax=Arthrobacter sp. CG_A4 TaxID=3071706 RepID=UPI002E15FB77
MLLLSGTFRHTKAIGGWGPAFTCLERSSIPLDAAGVAVGPGPADVVAQLTGFLATHQARDRFPATGA